MSSIRAFMGKYPKLAIIDALKGRFHFGLYWEIRYLLGSLMSIITLANFPFQL